ncbi:MAG: Nif3-like dinuclear metal center hexameric protein [Clostridia bacterium]|nr:Nif3-like dinuclear metal center hexameric protein [Clostridia bacterium]
MKVRELYNALDAYIPRSLSCEWDNDGLLCCPNGEREVSKILIALDVTGAVVEYAKKEGYDFILSHHPIVYKGLKSVDDEGYVSAKLISLIESGIAVASFHTRLDALEGGVNDKLCELFGILDSEPIYEDKIPLGRVGNLANAMSAEDFAKKVKSTLGAPFVLLSDRNVLVSRVAVVGGNGGDLISAARAMGADTFVSGRLDYHTMTDAPDYKTMPINLIEAGHFYTEHPVCEVLLNIVKEIAPNVKCDIYFSNVIKAI